MLTRGEANKELLAQVRVKSLPCRFDFCSIPNQKWYMGVSFFQVVYQHLALPEEGLKIADL